MTCAHRLPSASAVLLCILLLAGGCGPRFPIGMIAVTGTVTMGGKPVPKGDVHFIPEDQSKTAAARISNGRFQASVWPLSYRLAVSSNAQPGMVDEQTGQQIPAVSLVPEKYRSATTSGLTVTIDADHRTVAIDITE